MRFRVAHARLPNNRSLSGDHRSYQKFRTDFFQVIAPVS